MGGCGGDDERSFKVSGGDWQWFVGVVVMALIDDRSVHGFATKDHSMWKFHSSFCHGREIPYRPSCHGSCFHCCWASRSPPARCHCPGHSFLSLPFDSFPLSLLFFTLLACLLLTQPILLNSPSFNHFNPLKKHTHRDCSFQISFFIISLSIYLCQKTLHSTHLLFNVILENTNNMHTKTEKIVIH